jgi:hypothetical protein
LVVCCAALAACGGDSKPRVLPPDPARETSDAPAKPPSGWRTVRNPRAGFSIAIPRDWAARTRRGATLIRSGDHLLALTVAADRGELGREIAPRAYARRTLAALPGFKGGLQPLPGDALDSPYANARMDARGKLERGGREQRVSAIVFQRKGRVSYVAIAFRNADVHPRLHDEELTKVLQTLRAQPPVAGSQ